LEVGAVDVPESDLMAAPCEMDGERRAPRSSPQDSDRFHELEPPLSEKRRSSPRSTRRRFSRWRATTRIESKAPSQKIGLRTPRGASHRSAVANAIAPNTEPSDTKRVAATVATHTRTKIPNAVGASASNTPAVVATPLPPRNPAKQVHTWPAT